MPFITSFSKDPIRDLSNKFDQFQRQKSEDEARQALRNEALYGLRLPGLTGIGENRVPNPFSNDRLGVLQAQARANKTRNDRLRDDIGPISYDMLNFPDEYLLRTPEKRSQMANKTRQSANNVMAGLGMLASLGVPAAMGAGMLTRGLTGAALNTGLSVPIYRADPESADPLLDAAMGAGIGMAGLPGMILGGLLGYTPEIDADQEIPRYAGGGIVKGGLNRLAKYFKDEELTRKGVADIIKESGGNWLGGRVEKSLDSLKQPYIPNPTPEQISYPLGSAEAERELLENTRGGALNRWIEGPLTKYVKRDLATPKDPVRALAEQGILHYAPELELSQYLTQMRDKQGFPAWGVGKSQLASAWEARADRSIHPTRARGYQTDTRDLNENPWLEKLAPNDPVYLPMGGSSFPANLGFDHLTDELRNALNPESGLPRSLLLTPEDMKQMGIDRAVRHVDKINKYRAKEMERAALADMEGMPVIKEYPEGFKWVELKAPQLPQDKIRSVQTPFGWRIEDQFVTPRFKGDPLMYKTEEEARAAHAARGDEEMLSRWLKQEGDIMGHCVGGYCDDVLGGRSRIFSLRDEKGRPHVTIEVSPGPNPEVDAMGDWDKFPEDLQDYIMKTHGSGSVGWARRVQEDPKVKEWFKDNTPPIPDSIAQIKGKSNLKPKDEYLPFVQDFVKTQGPWGDVGDLGNTGLYLRNSLPEVERGLMPELGDYLTLEEIKKLREGRPWTPIDTDPEFAEGGLVTNPAHEDLLKILEQHKPDLNSLLSGTGVKFANGGIVRSPEILKIINECGGKYGSE